MRKKIFCLLLALTFALSCSDKKEEESGGIREKTSGETIALEVNSPAPAFAGKTLGGGQLKLSDYVGKVIIIEFWSIFCKSCLEEMPKIKELHAKYASHGLAVLSVNTDTFSDARITKTLEKAGMTFEYPVVRDMRKEVSVAYNVELLPVTIIIDRSGWIRLYQEGYRPGDETRFEKVIAKYLDDTGDEDVTLAPRGGVTTFAPGGQAKAQAKEILSPTGKTIDGEPLDLGGKPAVLFFWSLYCQPCREELPEIAKFKQKLGPGGADFIAVNIDSDKLADRIRKFLAPYPDLKGANDLSFGKNGLAAQYGVTATPTAVLIDKTGAPVFTATGLNDLPELERKLSSLK